MTLRLAVVTSHPIQYQTPLFRLLTERGRVVPEVFFLSDHGVEPSFDPGMGQLVRYDIALTEGYAHRFLPNRAWRPSIATFTGAFHPALAPALAGGGFDAVLVLGYAQLSDWVAYGAAAATGMPYLLRGDTPDPPATSKQGLRWRAKRALLGGLVRHAAGCTAIGLANARYYASLGAPAERIFWVPYSVDDEAFRRGGEIGRRERRDRLGAIGLDPDRPVIVYSAKLVPRKRPLDVVAAVKRLGGRVQLVMMGDGELRPEVERAVGDDPDIALLGFVNQSDIGAWYGVGDLFVLASAVEPWGLVVNEAIAAGAVPVVSDAVGCAPDLVAGAGRVFATGDVEALARSIDELLDPLVLADARSLVAARAERYSLAATADGIESAVARVAGGGG